MQYTRRDFLSATTGVILAGAAGCSKNPVKPPNIIWIMTDDQRQDSLRCYGSSWVHSPNLDALAESGVRFNHAVVQSPICAPSRSSMLTAQYPHSVDVMAHEDTISEHAYPLTLVFANHGYQVVNVGKVHMPGGTPFPKKIKVSSSRSKIANSFEWKTKEYDAQEHGVYKLNDWLIVAGTYPLPEEETEQSYAVSTAIRFMEEDLREPFFLRVSIIAPHTPVLPPRPYDKMYDPNSIPLLLPSQRELNSKPQFERTVMQDYSGSTGTPEAEIRKAWASYYGFCASVDHQIGRLLDAVERNGLRENTLIVFCSDHGVQMGEHGLFFKRNFYEQTILSPLIFSLPGQLPEGAAIDEQVELIDLLPTLLDITGHPVRKGVQGRSLLPLIRGRGKGREITFSELDHSRSYYEKLRENSGRLVMARTNEWKLVYFYGKEEKQGSLYNLASDPGETRNLYNENEYRHIIRELESEVEQWNANT